MPDVGGNRSQGYTIVEGEDRLPRSRPPSEGSNPAGQRPPTSPREVSLREASAKPASPAKPPASPWLARATEWCQAANPLNKDGRKEAVLLILVLSAVALLLAAVFLLPGQAGRNKVKPGPPLPRPLRGRCRSKLRPKESLCTGCPPMRDGKLCASTTRYNDMTKGACGCGDQDPVPPNYWTMTEFTAALNCKNLDPVKPLLSWCPAGCGACFELCSTGGTTSGKPNTTKGGVCRVFTVTNRCGDGYKEYPEWCSNELTYEECRLDPSRCKQWGSTNKYGYPAHFDLQDYHLQVSTGLGWDNAEVTFEPVACSSWTGALRECKGCTLVNKGQWQEHGNATTATTV